MSVFELDLLSKPYFMVLSLIVHLARTVMNIACVIKAPVNTVEL